MKIGIIGGSGLEYPKILKDAKEIKVETKFGKPSSSLTVGKIDGVDVVVWVKSAGDEAEVFYSDVDGDDKHYY